MTRPRYLTAAQAARELSLSARLILSWYERGILPAFPIRGERRVLLFDVEAIIDAERITRRGDRARRRAREVAIRAGSAGG